MKRQPRWALFARSNGVSAHLKHAQNCSRSCGRLRHSTIVGVCPSFMRSCARSCECASADAPEDDSTVKIFESTGSEECLRSTSACVDAIQGGGVVCSTCPCRRFSDVDEVRISACRSTSASERLASAPPRMGVAKHVAPCDARCGVSMCSSGATPTARCSDEDEGEASRAATRHCADEARRGQLTKDEMPWIAKTRRRIITMSRACIRTCEESDENSPTKRARTAKDDLTDESTHRDSLAE